MKIQEIHYNSRFIKQYEPLPLHIKKKIIKMERLLRKNPFHPSLRLHKLEGKLDGSWSISVDRYYRIIFKVMTDGNIVFASVGGHAIYGK